MAPKTQHNADNPPRIVKPPTPEESRDIQSALSVRDRSAAGWIYFVVNATLGEEIGPDAFAVLREMLLLECGSPNDPIETMLIDQLALCHHSIGQLRIRSCAAEQPEIALQYHDAATKLLSEFRRLALALEDFRAKRASRLNAAQDREQTASTNRQPKPQEESLAANSVGASENPPHLKLVSKGVPSWLKDRMSQIPAG